MGRMMNSPVWGSVNREVITEHLEEGTWDPTYPSPCDYYAYAGAYGVRGCKHPGLDVAMPEGTPLYAARAGVVDHIRNEGITNRIEVVIKDANGHQHAYNHMRSDVVSVGQAITQGQHIGYSGFANSPHLHFEHRVPDPTTTSGWSFVSPEPVLTGTTPVAMLPRFRNGDRAIVTSGPLNLRDAMSTTSNILAVLDTGTTMCVARGPFNNNGYKWWRVNAAGFWGYVVDDFIGMFKAGGCAVVQGFANGAAIKCIEGPVNVRLSGHTTADILSSVAVGEVVTVVFKSTSTDGGYTWYKIRKSNGLEGYCVGKFFAVA